MSLDKIGENVLVGIIDVGGLDFAHPDFMDDQGKSRIVAIWDQGGDSFRTARPHGGRGQGRQVDRLWIGDHGVAYRRGAGRGAPGRGLAL